MQQVETQIKPDGANEVIQGQPSSPKEKVKQDMTSGSIKKKEKNYNLKSLLIKASLLGIIDLISFFLLIYYIGQTPHLTDQINQAVEENNHLSTESINQLRSQLNTHNEEIKLVDSYFKDPIIGIVNFANRIDQLRAQGLSISFEPKSTSVIRDKTRSSGIPFVIEVLGSEKQLESALNQIYEIPFLFRAVNVEIERIDDTNYLLNFGGFLYVENDK